MSSSLISTATAAATSAAASSSSPPHQYRAAGISLAIGSGVLIGTSFVFKKRGLLQSQAGHVAGEGVAYLKSPLWWTGMTMMICGELCNFGAYAFVEAILVTPLGALSVVISAILSHFVLKERLTLFGWIGCFQCLIGAVIIAINGPEEQSVSTIDGFKHLFLAPGFLAYGSVCIAVALGIIFFIAPRYGKKTMIWYILVCSLIGGISVSCTQGLGACILTSIRGENQFKNWFIYFLLVFVTITLLTEIFYLNVALALFNTAMVTPTYYVLFTFFTLVTSVILYQGLKASGSQILTIVLAFFVICSGIFVLQMSKIDPAHLTGVDEKTSLLLKVARQEVKPDREGNDVEKAIEATEEPGMDAVAGRFSGFGGTIVRARRRATIGSSLKRHGRVPDNLTREPRKRGNTAPETAEDMKKAREMASVGTHPVTDHLAPNGRPAGLPMHGSANGHAFAQILSSSDQIQASPMDSPSSQRSIRFEDEQNRPPNGLNHNHNHNHNHGHAPQISHPAPALVASSNTSLPSLHLPAPIRPSSLFRAFSSRTSSRNPSRRQTRQPDSPLDTEPLNDLSRHNNDSS